MSISTLKWPELARIAPSFIELEVLGADDVLVAGRGEEDVADLRGLGHRQHLEAVHHGLERPQRVDLGHDHVRAHAARARRDAAADPAVAGDDEALAGEQDVRGAEIPSIVDWPVP